jgi:drug/metabolite transporter (DMT)-like permease
MFASNPHSARAVQMLLLGTALWALSFPSVKAIAATQQKLVPGADSWFLAALCVLYRFAIAALLLALLTARTLPKLTRSELWQGLGLGLFGGAGILLQVDGLTYTFASTSAFLTQCYCLLIPIWVALCQRRWPAGKIFVSCALVVTGVAVLAGVDWRKFQLGRGEWETLAGSVAFTAQILWLERPKFARNNVSHFSIVMFATMALVCLPVALAKAPSAGAWITAFSTGPMIGFLAILVFPCTLGAYMLMNHWQRHVPATHAGLIYCVEPVFTSLYALFLPGWFSAWAGVTYPNETLTRALLLGGGLITFANVLLYLPVRRTNETPVAAATQEN